MFVVRHELSNLSDSRGGGIETGGEASVERFSRISRYAQDVFRHHGCRCCAFLSGGDFPSLKPVFERRTIQGK